VENPRISIISALLIILESGGETSHLGTVGPVIPEANPILRDSSIGCLGDNRKSIGTNLVKDTLASNDTIFGAKRYRNKSPLRVESSWGRLVLGKTQRPTVDRALATTLYGFVY
jgi:hypothetical protein